MTARHVFATGRCWFSGRCSCLGYFAHKYKENPPVMVVCEASAADCLYRSAVQADGNLVNVTGDLQTIMAGLACGEIPSDGTS